MGDHDISKGDETPYATLYASKKIIKHSGYVGTSESKNSDIALLQTLDPIRWKRTIGPACLPYLYKGYDDYFDSYPLTGKDFLKRNFAFIILRIFTNFDT